MFLHCHTPNCHWSQDDFWEKDGYTPFREDLVESMKEELFRDKVYMDSNFFMENPSIPHGIDHDGVFCKGTDLVAWNLERKARNIRNMLVKTYEEFKAKKDDLVCPKCGEQNWDID